MSIALLDQHKSVIPIILWIQGFYDSVNHNVILRYCFQYLHQMWILPIILPRYESNSLSVPIKAELRRCHKISQVFKIKTQKESIEGRNKQGAKALMHCKTLFCYFWAISHSSNPFCKPTGLWQIPEQLDPGGNFWPDEVSWFRGVCLPCREMFHPQVCSQLDVAFPSKKWGSERAADFQIYIELHGCVWSSLKDLEG